MNELGLTDVAINYLTYSITIISNRTETELHLPKLVTA